MSCFDKDIIGRNLLPSVTSFKCLTLSTLLVLIIAYTQTSRSLMNSAFQIKGGGGESGNIKYQDQFYLVCPIDKSQGNRN